MKKQGTKIITALLTAAMMVGTMGLGNVYAADAIDTGSVAANSKTDIYDYAEEQDDQDSYPETYDLRNVDGVSYVTNVKFQNPWGTCWAFAYTAAAEISILGETGGLAENPDLDLSEHHLAWFAKNHLTDSVDNQSGEGIYTTGESASTSSMSGGLSYYATIPYASGMGVVSESAGTEYEYHGTAEKVRSKSGKVYDSYEDCIAAGEIPFYYASDDDWSMSEDLRFGQSYKLEETFMLPSVTPIENEDGTVSLNEDGIDAIKEQLTNKRGVAIAYCSDNSQPGQTANQATARFVNENWAHFTWTNDAEDYAWANHEVCIVGWDDNYSAENFTITNPVAWDEYQNILYKLNPELDLYTESGAYYYLDDDNEQVFLADVLYDYVDAAASEDGTHHFKDNVELENDSDGNTYYPDSDEMIEDELITPQHDSGTYTPEGDGAWIVKNSWGSLVNSDGTESEFPNACEGGVDNTGYFYISYYDRSVCTPEAFDFITSEEDGEYDYSYVQQYDYLPTTNTLDMAALFPAGTQCSIANAFASTEALELTATSCVTTRPNTTVTYELYVDDGSDNDDPVSTITATYEYGGYHRENFEKSIIIPANQMYVIVVTMTYEDNGQTCYAAPMNWSYGKGDNANNYSVGVINAGESYLITGDISDQTSWTDMAGQIEELKQAFVEQGIAKDAQFDNFSIKAYSNPVGTVTFDANGHGTAPDVQYVSAGKLITEPAAMTDSKYTFAGWYTEATCENKWDFAKDTMPTNDITLYAKWEAKSSSGSNSNSNSKSPNTGLDDSYIYLILALMIMAAGSAVIVEKTRKKRQ